MADPVAEKSGFLCTYMSNHPDTLVAYAKWFGKITDNISSAEMSAIDTKSITLTCSIKGTKDKKVVVVPINPPLAGYAEVKPRLLEMKAEAQEGLGMIKAPQITSYRWPRRANSTILIYAIMLYITFPDAVPKSPLFQPARAINAAIGGSNTMLRIWQAWFGIHFLEALYTHSLCRRHSTPLVTGTLYVLSTFIFGFSIWADLRKRIQTARIDSVMKIQ